MLEDCGVQKHLARAYFFQNTVSVCPILLSAKWRENFDCAVAHELGHIAHVHWNYFRLVKNELEADVYAATLCGWHRMEKLRKLLTTKDSQYYYERFLYEKSRHVKHRSAIPE